MRTWHKYTRSIVQLLTFLFSCCRTLNLLLIVAAKNNHHHTVISAHSACVTWKWNLYICGILVFKSKAQDWLISILGKIQGAGQKFLDRFKSYLGSQISSQSLNEIHICQLQPKSTPKGEFFHIFLSLIVSSSRWMLPFDVWPSFPVRKWTLS